MKKKKALMNPFPSQLFFSSPFSLVVVNAVVCFFESAQFPITFAGVSFLPATRVFSVVTHFALHLSLHYNLTLLKLN